MTTAFRLRKENSCAMRFFWSALGTPWNIPQSTSTFDFPDSTTYAEPVTSPPPAPNSVTFMPCSLFCDESIAHPSLHALVLINRFRCGATCHTLVDVLHGILG